MKTKGSVGREWRQAPNSQPNIIRKSWDPVTDLVSKKKKNKKKKTDSKYTYLLSTLQFQKPCFKICLGEGKGAGAPETRQGTDVI